MSCLFANINLKSRVHIYQLWLNRQTVADENNSEDS